MCKLQKKTGLALSFAVNFLPAVADLRTKKLQFARKLLVAGCYNRFANEHITLSMSSGTGLARIFIDQAHGQTKV